jgi:hypothetical protein
MSFPTNTDTRTHYYGKPSDFQSPLAISPATRRNAREDDATMAQEGRSDGDYQVQEPEGQRLPESSPRLPASTRPATWYGDE